MRKIIDAHCHVFPDKIAQKASDSIGDFYDLEAKCDGSVELLNNYMKECRIEKAIIQSVATTKQQVGSINEFIAKTVEEGSGKYIGFGTLHHESDDIEGDINELISLGLKGIKLHPDIQGVSLDDKRIYKMFEICEGRLPFLIHTGDDRYNNSNPNKLVPVLKTFKNLTVIGAHFGGYSIWEEATEKLHDFENFYTDTSSTFFRVSPETAIKMLHKYDSEKIFFGTDYPLWKPSFEIKYLNMLNIEEELKEKIFGLNAERFINNL